MTKEYYFMTFFQGSILILSCIKICSQLQFIVLLIVMMYIIILNGKILSYKISVIEFFTPFIFHKHCAHDVLNLWWLSPCSSKFCWLSCIYIWNNQTIFQICFFCVFACFSSINNVVSCILLIEWTNIWLLFYVASIML